MKIYFTSDLHADINENSYQNTIIPSDSKTSAFVLAGDVNTHLQGMHAINLFRKACEYYSTHFKYVIAVLGNHDYYGSDIKNIFIKKIKNVFLLDKTSYLELEDCLIYGDTFWSGLGDMMNNCVSKYILQTGNRDFQNIRNGSDVFANKIFLKYMTPDDMIQLHHLAVYNLFEFMKIPHQKKIVVTHFSPSMKGVAPEFKNSLFNEYFHGDMDFYIQRSDIRYWIHGHTHNSLDYYIGMTNIVCNPMGYKQYENTNYNPLRYIEC